MRKTTVTLISAALALALLAVPAFGSSSADNWDINYAEAYLVGTDEGLDFVEVRLTERAAPGEREVFLHLVVCDVKFAGFPTPPGLKPECWSTGFGTQDLAVNHLVFSTDQIRFSGDVEMLCDFPGTCDGKTSQVVNVELEWTVNDSSHQLSRFSPFPGLKVTRNTWTLSTAGISLEMSDLPVDLENLAPTSQSAQLEKTHVVEN